MTIQTLELFFIWCSTINFSILLFSSLMLVSVPDFVFGIHSRLFGLSRDAFNISVYAFLGLFKLFLLFNLVPYLALRAIG